MDKTKTMNTLENKAKFFAQYWGQCVLGQEDKRTTWILNSNTWQLGIDYLELKPLSSISDEDAIGLLYAISETDWSDKVVEKALWGKSYVDSFIKQKLTPKSQTIALDYLRSKGYALDWNGITVEQQIEKKWIKLKQ